MELGLNRVTVFINKKLGELNVVQKDYIYTCSRSQISLHCNISACRTRKYGIGSENALPNVHSLKKINTDLVIWSLDTYGDIWSELTIKLVNN